ncbi:MAG: hydrogenase expression/formation protein HypE [Deltaproteobacteria bacterium]|nr:hydrogenase expression/formation protein HypE [Deltaproteobacteria bacterium]
MPAVRRRVPSGQSHRAVHGEQRRKLRRGVQVFEVRVKSETIQLAHGGGGRASADLIAHEILSRFGSPELAALPDAATLPALAGPLVVSTDGFVVSPIEFPGGNIGHLAVHGTVNDVAVAGGRPIWLSLAMILEEGLPVATLRRVLDAVRDSARDCGVTVMTGDTKVVPRGMCDGMYLTTTGIGEAWPGLALDAARIREGDVVIVSGPLGDHGMAIMAARNGLRVADGFASDTGPVHRLVESVVDLGDALRFFRDPTRGGAAAVLNEIVRNRTVGIVLRETDLPVSPGARGVSELLGIDILHVASEGRVIGVCAANAADEVLARWRGRPEGVGAFAIGRVTGDAGRVILETAIGGRRLVDVPQGELLPRIC